MRAARIAAMALGVFLLAVEAFAWEIQTTNKGVPAWRPTPGHVKPSPGNPPAPLEINHDLRTAPDGAGELLKEAMETWNAVEGATVTIEDAGETSCAGGPSCKNDGYNSVTWVSDADNWPWTSYVLAMTYWVSPNYDGDTGEVTETDMQINGVNIWWSTKGFPAAGETDLLSVLVHELGHMCMLADLYDPRYAHSTMFGTIRPGSVRAASLHEDDENGLRFLYPETEGDIPAPRVTGFKVSGDSQFRDKVIGNRGDIKNGVEVKGYGFIETDGVKNLEVSIYKNGAPASSPAASVASFTDYSRFTVDIDLSASSIGEYDMMVINPDNKADVAFGAVQVNDPGNTPPYVSLESCSAVALREKTVCAEGSDADGDALTFSWELAVKPERSSAALNSTTGECVSFTPDLPGYYLLEVTVSDGTVCGYSAASLITVSRFPTIGGDEGLGGGCAIGAYAQEKAPGADMIVFVLLPFLLMAGGKLYLRTR